MQLHNSQTMAIDLLKQSTDDFGLLSQHSSDDMRYTLMQNARALTEVSRFPGNETAAKLADVYVGFVLKCQQDHGYFFNFLDAGRNFSNVNYHTNLCESNGFAIEALATYLEAFQPAEELENRISEAIRKSFPKLSSIHTLSAIARALRGMIVFNRVKPSFDNTSVILMLANKLTQSYRHESSVQWQWFDNRLALCDAVVASALLHASIAADNKMMREIARKTMEFLLESTFVDDTIRVETISSFKSPAYKTHPQLTMEFSDLLHFIGEFQSEFGGFDHWLREISAWFEGKNDAGRPIIAENGLAIEGIGTVSQENRPLATIVAANALALFELPEAAPARSRRTTVIKDAVARITEEIRSLSKKIESVPELYMSITQSPLYISGQLEQHAEERLGQHLAFLREKYTAHLQSRGLTA